MGKQTASDHKKMESSRTRGGYPNPKSECRNPKQISKSKIQTRTWSCIWFGSFGFCISDLFRISYFEFRIYLALINGAPLPHRLGHGEPPLDVPTCRLPHALAQARIAKQPKRAARQFLDVSLGDHVARFAVHDH